MPAEVGSRWQRGNLLANNDDRGEAMCALSLRIMNGGAAATRPPMVRRGPPCRIGFEEKGKAGAALQRILIDLNHTRGLIELPAFERVKQSQTSF
jgi:hypothetical protein